MESSSFIYGYGNEHDDDCTCDDCVDSRLWNIQLQTCVVAGQVTIEACNHHTKYCLKTLVRNSALTGPNWVRELWLGHERRFFQNMRTRKEMLRKLIYSLVSIGGISSKVKHVSLEESLAIFLLIVGLGVTYPMVEERLQRSSETVSNHFHMVLNGVCKFGLSMVRPLEGYFDSDPQELVNNSVGSPYFRGCVGAIDGTHIELRIPENSKVPWINRKGITSTNVLAICDFNMCITFASVGMEGSMHDCRLLSESLRNPNMQFPHPPPSKYYLADAGYPLMPGFLTPYKSTRYHLPEFRGNRNFSGKKEQFNYRHSSVRSVIERTFGVLKKRWRILNNMSCMELSTQIKIIWACITLHTFIRRYDSGDIDLLGELTPEDIELSSVYRSRADIGGTGLNLSQGREMEAFRDFICSQMP